jgi:hypothetical protein
MAHGYDRRFRLAGSLALVSLACAVTGLLVVPLAFLRLVAPDIGFVAFPAEILAIAIGHVARDRGGVGMALAGLRVGYGFFILVILYAITLLFFFHTGDCCGYSRSA